LIQLHDRLNPGVVNINVIVSRQGQFGQGAGSGFIIDDQGHIVTNNHVIEGATQVTVVFFNGFESEAQVIGADPDSDLAVVQVNNVPNNAHPLELGDSDKVQVGEWVIAIGNPFGQTSSMTVGIVSATGRLLESGVANYSIPQGIQTDAAINPGNSGGPLLNMLGEVIGVNAQIQTGGVAANAGVGFAIPSNVVRHVVPTLIQEGVFQWPYLGVSGGPVNLFIAQANNLQTQQGAYIDSVTPGGPAAQAGLRGTQSTTQEGIPVGGDVVVAANGQPINSFQDLLAVVAFSRPGDTLDLTIVRNSQQRNVTVTLAPRP
jgi:2-alkenal reductase